MDHRTAKQRLRAFFAERTLTFRLDEFPGGEWIASCNEIPGIITGGTSQDRERDRVIRDAIVRAAGLDSKFADILQNRGTAQPGGRTSRAAARGYVVAA